ncbi:MAG: flagellar export protein FliJ [FCB group bacterium]
MAKVFNFRLDPLLKIRTHKKKVAEEAFAHAVNKRLNKENEITGKEDYFTSLLKSKSGKVPIIELQHEYYHKNFVKEEIKQLKLEKVDLIEIEDKKRIALTEAMKDEKILDKLKEKQKIVYIDEIEKEEQKILDDIAIELDKNKEKVF